MRAKIAALCQIQATAAAARAEAANSAATGTTEFPSLVSTEVDIEVEDLMTLEERVHVDFVHVDNERPLPTLSQSKRKKPASAARGAASSETTLTTLTNANDEDVLVHISKRARDSEHLKSRLEDILAEVDPVKAEKGYWGAWLGACSGQVPPNQWQNFRDDTYQVVRNYLPTSTCPRPPRSYMLILSSNAQTAPASGQFQPSGASRFPTTGQSTSQEPNVPPFQFVPPSGQPSAQPSTSGQQTSGTGSTFGGNPFNTNQPYVPSFSPQQYSSQQSQQIASGLYNQQLLPGRTTQQQQTTVGNSSSGSGIQ